MQIFKVNDDGYDIAGSGKFIINGAINDFDFDLLTIAILFVIYYC